MDRRTIRDVAAAVAAGVGVLLLADLSLGWYDVMVTAAGIVDITANATGWGHIGTVAGLLTIAMLVYMIRPMRRDGSVNLTQAAVTAVLGVGAFAFTVARALNGAASVNTTTTAVQVHSTLWPAYAGMALGAVMAGAVVTALVLVMRGVTAPSRVVQPTA